MNREWVTSIRDQSANAGVPLFFKQWGGLRKKQAGRTLDGRTYDEFPQRLPNSVSVAVEHLRWAAEIESKYSDFGAVASRDFGIAAGIPTAR
jgi:Protein of unknown function (DUF5131)